ncbi:uncharacterized protein LOC114314149 isoform X4 [Camellia sinensis]|uniref:uncharacterized protein LOC114314149 isoform X4 n=1 Tax=Camellia sinensis TaxID=4442 RepID=UPI0010358934|nr:uncharacterized protein LOC114314149 isoform X4 [Camellia sinensis]
MASLTSSFSPSSPPSASNSELSASQPTPPTPSHHQGSVKDGATDNGVPDALRQNPLSLDLYADMNSKEYIEKLNKYEADHICRVMAKYFSDKDIYGGGTFFIHMQTQYNFSKTRAALVQLLLQTPQL